MRLAPDDVAAIRQLVREQVGEAEILLFGSRVDDSAKGGDVDLLVTAVAPLNNPPLLAAQLAVSLERALHGRKVDVVLRVPGSPPLPIHQIALATGVRL